MYKQLLTFSKIAFFLVFFCFFYISILNSADIVQPNTPVAISGTTTLVTGGGGSLDLDIVDQSGNPVVSPSFSFPGKIFSWSGLQSTSSLGTSTQRIMISNFTVSNTWTFSISATSGESSMWDSGSYTYKYNGSASEGRLQINPQALTITPDTGCSSTGITKQSAAYFVSGSVSSINILEAGATTDTDCAWYIEDIGLTQDIPAKQPIGTYSIGMTLTVI